MMKNHLRPFVSSFFSCSNVPGIREKFFCKVGTWREMKGYGVLFRTLEHGMKDVIHHEVMRGQTLETD